MKKERNLLIVFFCLLFLYAIILIFFAVTRENWLSLALLLISIYLFVKTYFFRSDSSLFIAVLCVFLSITFNAMVIKSLSLNELSAFISMAVTYDFLLDYAIFGNKFCFWAFIANILTNLPIFLYTFHCINVILMILLLSGDLILLGAILLRKKYGKI